MAALKVKKEMLDSVVDFEFHGRSRRIVLKDATQEELQAINVIGVDVFEKAEKEK